MTTDITKVYKRRTKDPWNYQGRRLTVLLLPGDVIGFREERRRKVFTAPISWVYSKVVAQTVAYERAERKKKRKLKKMGA